MPAVEIVRARVVTAAFIIASVDKLFRGRIAEPEEGAGEGRRQIWRFSTEDVLCVLCVLCVRPVCVRPVFRLCAVHVRLFRVPTIQN